MKYIILFIALASFAAIGYGFSLPEEQFAIAQKYIGFGTASLFLVAMPLFLITNSKGKKIKDYMLTEENIRKLQGKETENTENQ